MPATDLQEDQDIKTALKLVEVAAFTSSEKEAYHSHMDRARIESTVLKDAKAEGKAEGVAQLIKAMRTNGMSVEQISQVTQLPVEAVQRSLNL